MSLPHLRTLAIAGAMAGLSSSTLDGAHDALLLNVTPRILYQGGDVLATASIDPSANNRTLEIAIDGPDYFASTSEQLDGEEAARTHRMMFRQLPAGEYTADAVVEREGGRPLHASIRFSVAGREPTIP